MILFVTIVLEFSIVARSGRKAYVAQDGNGDNRGRGPRRSPPRSSGPNRARRVQPKHDGGETPRDDGPPIPADIEAKQLAPEIRGELTTPTTLNRYTYAAGNPINAFDPDGYRVSIYVTSGQPTR